MPIVIANPAGTGSLVGPDQPVKLDAQVTPPSSPGNLQWSASVNGGASSVFATGSATAVYKTPSSISNQDAGSNKAFDDVVITVTDPSGHPPESATTALRVGPGTTQCEPTGLLPGSPKDGHPHELVQVVLVDRYGE